MRLGIDFGTTRTVVAYADRGNYPVLSFFNDAGDATDFYPSVVAERGGELRFGFDALSAAADPSWSLLRSFKRLLSGASLDDGYSLVVGHSLFTVREVVTRFLASLRHAVRTRSNLPAALLDPHDGRDEAVVASPANAHGTQRYLTLEAFAGAGFDVLMMLNEPSAAGFEHSHRHRDTYSARREHVVVYDLGGGTFDASLVRMRGAHHEAVTTAGINHLGGDDFDDILLDLTLERAGLRRRDVPERALSLLNDQCREAKERLSANARKIVLDLESCFDGDHVVDEVVIPVAEFYEACGFLVDRTVESMMPVIASLDRDEPLDPSRPLTDLAGVYVVGGASALPLIARALRQRFGRRVHRSPYPGAATAIGLAIASDAGATFTLSDRFSRHFGVFRAPTEGGEAVFDHVFGADTSLPASGDPPVVVRRSYRTTSDVGHFRFVECSAVDERGGPSGELTPSGELHFAFDPALRGRPYLERLAPRHLRGQGTRVEEVYAADGNGIVSVKIRTPDDGYEATFRLPNGTAVAR